MKFILVREKDAKGEWRREGERRREIFRIWLLPDNPLMKKHLSSDSPIPPRGTLYPSRHLLMLKSSSAFMHRNSWGVIWSHPNSWERCLIRTHWLYIRDLCMRYLGRNTQRKKRGKRRLRINPERMSVGALPFPVSPRGA